MVEGNAVSRVDFIRDRLHEQFGEPVRPPRLAPLDELIKTILSQNTNDRNRDIAFKALKGKFRVWKDAVHVPVNELARIIEPAGLGPTKSRWIHSILRKVYQDGETDILGLCEQPTEKALERLLSLNGVGPKTAACVLLFSCGRPVFPVDTHIYRVARRLDLLPEGGDRVKAHEVLGKIFPSDHYLELHLNIIRLGREFCRPAKPLCMQCPLGDMCSWAYRTSCGKKGDQHDA